MRLSLVSRMMITATSSFRRSSSISRTTAPSGVLTLSGGARFSTSLNALASPCTRTSQGGSRAGVPGAGRAPCEDRRAPWPRCRFRISRRPSPRPARTPAPAAPVCAAPTPRARARGPWPMIPLDARDVAAVRPCGDDRVERQARRVHQAHRQHRLLARLAVAEPPRGVGRVLADVAAGAGHPRHLRRNGHRARARAARAVSTAARARRARVRSSRSGTSASCIRKGQR